MRTRAWLPLAAFLGLAALVGWSLWRPADRTVRSELVSKPLPAFRLAPLVAGKPGVASADFGRGRPRLLNVFASWCVPCAAEAPQLMALRRAGVEIDAVAIRDTGPAVRAFLARYGDPYRAIGDDPQSAAQLALGSSGVPESFVVDGRGRIVRQHVGDIRAEDVPGLLATLRAAR
jgi:cytochrome c biogenesis protein CcmG, thiol:disulfide interchange protein DsbE